MFSICFPKMTLTPIVRTDRRRPDGFYRVYVRLTHQRKSRYIPTNLYARSSDVGRHGSIKSPSLMLRCARITEKMYRTVEDFSCLALDLMTIDKLREFILTKCEGNVFHLDFYEWSDQWLNTANISNGTKGTYRVALNTFKRWTGAPLDINAITVDEVKRFVASLNVNPNTVRMYVGYLSKLFNEARYKYNTEDLTVIPREPFKGLRIERVPSKGAPILETWQMQMIIDADDTTPGERRALNLFCLSFTLMGANLADIWQMEKPRRGEIRYNRAKTRARRDDHAEMRVKVTDEAAYYIDAIGGGKDGKLLEIRNKTLADLRDSVGDALHSWSARHGMKGLTFYSARKTWATVARSCGVEKATVDECLAHVGDFPIADIYIQRNWAGMAAANRKVLDRFRWPVAGAESKKILILAASS